MMMHILSYIHAYMHVSWIAMCDHAWYNMHAVMYFLKCIFLQDQTDQLLYSISHCILISSRLSVCSHGHSTF